MQHDNNDHTFTSRIATVCFLGRNNAYGQSAYRLTQMKRIIDELTKRKRIYKNLDALLFAGGYLSLQKPIGHLGESERLMALVNLALVKKLKAISKTLHSHFPAVHLCIGIDSRPIRHFMGGDELLISLQSGHLRGFARKAFPVWGDNGLWDYDKEQWIRPPFAINLDYSENPLRMITLRNGAKAVLLVCYEAFGARLIAGDNYYNQNYIYAYHNTETNDLGYFTSDERQAHIRKWIGFLHGEKPNLALTAIHSFEKAGRDGYWQRHGIAGLSAAMMDKPVFGASHFYNSLPQKDKSTLSSISVPHDHLLKPNHRLAHRLRPSHSFTLKDPTTHEPIALIRLFKVKHT
jgi:hypothetical protein